MKDKLPNAGGAGSGSGFWISKHDQAKHFSHAIAATLGHELKWSTARVGGAWFADDSEPGGSCNHPTWCTNKFFRFKVDVPTNAVIQLVWMGPSSPLPMGLVVYRSTAGEKKMQRLDLDTVVNQSKSFSSMSSVVLPLPALTPDYEYTVVPSTLEPQRHG